MKLLQKVRGNIDVVSKQPSEGLTVEELQIAGVEIIKYIQRQCFTDIRSLSSLHPVRSSSGVLCVGGRLKYAPIAEASKYQMILPKHHHVVNLIIKHYH